jgi:acyl-homoserine-lactone acylase
MKRLCPLLSACLLALLLSLPALSQKAAKTEATLYRDEWGIPHVFAPTLETASYALGYAQAEDRLEELLKNYRRANGTMSEVFGPENFAEDIQQRLFRHAEIAQAKYRRISPKMRAVIEAYQEGVKRFMKEHPEQVPAWAQEIHPWDVIALGRYIIWGWPLGEAAEDLGKIGVRPDPPPAYHGSNEMLIAPRRSALKVPLAVIDPHLSWYGQFRFYAERVYAGDYAVSGVCILGAPLPTLGHSRWCSVAMTTGGPDTTDVYEEELNPANPHQYRYDGKWREMQVRTEKIGVKVGDHVDLRTVTLESTHHGPVIAHKNGKAYAVATPYAEEVGLTDQTYAMMTAHNLNEMKRALAMRQLMMQNVMVGTVQGDIYYVRNGRVPVRAPGVDSSRPVPGSTSATEFRGLHPFSDLVQITNPPSGYMHNCNVSPFGMMRDSPLTPERAAFPYLYNATRDAPRHQRAEMMTELLDAAENVTVEQMIDIAFSPQVWHAERWQERLKPVWDRFLPTIEHLQRLESTKAVLDQILAWNRRSQADSEGALAFYAFKKGLGGSAQSATEPPAELTDPQILTALTKAADWLQTTFGSLHVPYGRYFRVGRQGGEKTWPVGGGSLNGGPNAVGMATPRAISFHPEGKVMVGHGGQTSTQIVALTNPPQSWFILPLGESDHKESGHWDDQAERLFSQSRAGSTYFLNKPELLRHITATKVLMR